MLPHHYYLSEVYFANSLDSLQATCSQVLPNTPYKACYEHFTKIKLVVTSN